MGVNGVNRSHGNISSGLLTAQKLVNIGVIGFTLHLQFSLMRQMVQALSRMNKEVSGGFQMNPVFTIRFPCFARESRHSNQAKSARGEKTVSALFPLGPEMLERVVKHDDVPLWLNIC